MTETGRIFGGRYEVTGPLASGGMSEVYMARDNLLGRPVALKILHPDLARDRQFIERFRREAQSAASLNDPRVVAVYDWGSDEGTYYLVMEYVEGKSLKDLIQAEGPFTMERAEEVVAEVCSALHFAHRHGLVHRDVKPANIMITTEGKTKVMDFGIARVLTQDPGATATQAGTVLGTANYLSPEQAQGLTVDARSDVYSVGVVLYEMLTQHVPFKADTAVAIAYKHVKEPPKPPSQLNHEVSPELDAVVLKALAKNPENRYQSADEMRLDLQRLLAGQAVEATPILLPTDRTVAMGPVQVRRESTTVIPAVRESGPATPDRRGLAYALLLVLIAALLVGAGSLVYGVMTGGTAQVGVPKLVGMTADQATAALNAAGLKPSNLGSTPSDAYPSGQVISQNPQDGIKVDRGSTVSFTTSSGSPNAQIPDVANESLADAQAAITAAGFVVATAPPEFSATVAVGKVTKTVPAGGTSGQKGSTVTIYTSGGKAPALLSDVTGFTQDQAVKTLKAEGFNPVVASGCDAGQNPGVVYAQNPPGNNNVAAGSDVNITINQAKAIPNVVGMSQQDASNALSQAGFQVGSVTNSGIALFGSVVSAQNPGAGTVACPQASVNITLSPVGTSPSP